MLVNLKRYPEALPYFKKAVELNREDADALYKIGLVYAAIGEEKKACDSYKRSAQLNNADAAAQYENTCGKANKN